MIFFRAFVPLRKKALLLLLVNGLVPPSTAVLFRPGVFPSKIVHSASCWVRNVPSVEAKALILNSSIPATPSNRASGLSAMSSEPNQLSTSSIAVSPASSNSELNHLVAFNRMNLESILGCDFLQVAEMQLFINSVLIHRVSITTRNRAFTLWTWGFK